MNDERDYSGLDQVLIGLSNALRTLMSKPVAGRSFPAGEKSISEELSEKERKRSAGYMRVNHVGEICAQALYQSQALTARDLALKMKMEDAAAEEEDHLAWCAQRLDELGSHESLLNPLWYMGSFTIGALAGLGGDRWNLGFVAETEQQVVKHLESHLETLPERDVRSREVVAQMREDEAQHAEMAIEAGAVELPLPVRGLMKVASGVMTRVAYWV